MSLFKDSSITFATKILSFLVQLLIAIILARILGPTARGEYALLVLVPTLMTMLSSLGIEVSNIYFVGSGRFDLRYIVSNSLISAIGFGAIVITFLYLYFAHIHLTFLKDANPFYLKLSIIIVPVLLINKYFLNILLGKRLIALYNSLNIFSSFFYLFVLIVFLLILKFHTLGALISWMLTAIFTCCLLIYSINMRTEIKLNLNYEVWKNCLSFGTKGYVANLTSYLGYRIDMLMVSYFLGAKQVGFYAIAVVIAETFWFISYSVSTVLAPRVASSTHSQSNLLTSQAARNVIFLTFISVLTFFLIDNFCINVAFGNEFLPSVIPLRILYPGIITLACARVIYSDLLGRGKPAIAMIASIIAVTVNIILNLFLIPIFGIPGAALASTVSYTIAAAIAFIWFIKISQCEWKDVLFINSLDLKAYLNIPSKLRFQRMVNKKISR